MRGRAGRLERDVHHRSLGAGAAVAALAYAAFSVDDDRRAALAGDPLTRRFGPPPLVWAGAAIAGTGTAAALIARRAGCRVAGSPARGGPEHDRAPGTPGRAESGDSGPAIAAVGTIGYAGFLVGPPVIGALADLTSLSTALVVIPVLAFAMALFAPATRTRVPAGRAAPASRVGRRDPAAARRG